MEKRNVNDLSRAFLATVFTLIFILLGCGTTAVQQTPAAKETGVLISGVVKDYDGKPVNEGFVMVKNNPYLWALTDAKGRFAIRGLQGRQPGALMISGAACQVAKLSVDGFIQENLAIKLNEQDPELTRLEIGCALTMMRKAGWLARNNEKRRPPAGYEKEFVAAYENFIKGKGKSILDKIVAGKELDTSELPYRFILHAQLALQNNAFLRRPSKPLNPEHHYLKSLIENAHAVLAKGVWQKPLSVQDIETLRLFRAMQGAFAPNFPRLKNMTPSIPRVSLARGSTIPEIFLADFDALLKSPNYSDHESLGLTEFLRFKSLAFHLAAFSSYDVRDGKLIAAGKEKLKRIYPNDWERFVSTRELIKSGRPTLLVWNWFEDGTHPAANILFAEYIKRAYRGKVDVYHIAESSPSWGDTYIPETAFFGVNPKSNSSKGLLGRIGEEGSFPLERTTRMVKLSSMRHLSISLPVLQVLPGITYRHLMDSWPTVVLLDAKGVSAVKTGQGAKSARIRWTGSWFDWYTPFEVSGIHFGSTTERALRTTLKNDGQCDPKEKHPLPDYPSRNFNSFVRFQIVETNASKSILVAHKFAKGDTLDKTTTYRFQLRPEARITLEREDDEEEKHYRLGNFEDLQPGMSFYADIEITLKSENLPNYSDKPVAEGSGLKPYDIKLFSANEINTVRVQNYRPQTKWTSGEVRKLMPLFGSIIKTDGKTMTVRVDQDYVRSLLGLRFWSEHGEDANMDDELIHHNNIRTRYKVLKRWAEGGDKQLTYTFALDPAVRICRNGIVETKPAKLAPGDYVWVMYELWWESQDMYSGIIYPETIMASEPIKK